MKRILITGAYGFLGHHVTKLITERVAPDIVKWRKEDPEYYLELQEKAGIFPIGREHGDLRIKAEVEKLFDYINPTTVFHLAANCGGIKYNQDNPGSLFYDNMMINLNVVEACREHKVKNTVLLGSVCGYPRITPVTIKEDSLFNWLSRRNKCPIRPLKAKFTCFSTILQTTI